MLEMRRVGLIGWLGVGITAVTDFRRGCIYCFATGDYEMRGAWRRGCVRNEGSIPEDNVLMMLVVCAQRSVIGLPMK
jgi:hypothetical protein